jgi:HrpA-like RNA helicase
MSNDEENVLIPTGLIALTIAITIKETNDGAILVFLPGLDNIRKVKDALEINSPLLGVDFRTKSFHIIMLHSELADAQIEVFDPAPDGCRKIILATNIAETSVTISDVKYGMFCDLCSTHSSSATLD